MPGVYDAQALDTAPLLLHFYCERIFSSPQFLMSVTLSYIYKTYIYIVIYIVIHIYIYIYVGLSHFRGIILLL